MPQFSVRFDDHGVYTGLRKFAGALPQLTRDELDSVMDNAKRDASGGYSGGASYAVQPPMNSTYQRTGNLGRSTYWEREGQTYRMYSVAIDKRGRAYSVYVVGDASGSGQADIHQGRWPLLADVMTKWAQIAVDRMRAAIDKAVGGFGL
jgi:hypothetical protein